jgi:hypothetical protein
MSQAHGTNVSTLFVGQALKRYFPETFFADITHREFKAPGSNIEAKIIEQGQQFQILDITGGALQTYNGSDLTATEPTEVRSLLTINQTRAVLELIKDINTFKSQVKNPKFSVIEQLKNNLKQFTEGYILSFWSDAASGNWIGTNYDTGTVTVAATTGVVTGSGTTFTAAMVGKPFQAAGHTKWYRVSDYTSATSITIENDSDDLASAYDGGAIGAGATYVIQANTALALTGTNVFDTLVRLGTLLDIGDVPAEDRYIVLPHEAKRSIMASAKVNQTLIEVHDAQVVKGMLYKETVSGLRVYFSRFVPGNNTSGYNVIAGHKNFIGAGFGMISSLEEIKPEKNFGIIVKGLFGCGAKVADGRRKFGCHLFATFAA